MIERPTYDLLFPDGVPATLGARTLIMGVLNVTPDSFSDGGRYCDPVVAVEAAERMVGEGAEWIDVGGESTRPGADPVDSEEECRRVLPVVEALRGRVRARISVDTTKAEVARRALDAGADLINDVSGLGDPAMAPLLAERQAPVVLMHMRGNPQTMQRRTGYADLEAEVLAFLQERCTRAAEAGLHGGKILLDPGIGFGKSAAGSMRLLARLPRLQRLDRPILVGASRKSFIGKALDLPVERRLEGSLAVAAYASAQGAHVVRVHDVEATARAVGMIDAIRAAVAGTA